MAGVVVGEPSYLHPPVIPLSSLLRAHQSPRSTEQAPHLLLFFLPTPATKQRGAGAQTHIRINTIAGGFPRASHQLVCPVPPTLIEREISASWSLSDPASDKGGRLIKGPSFNPCNHEFTCRVLTPAALLERDPGFYGGPGFNPASNEGG